MQFRPVKEQLEILMRGVIDVVPQEELEKKLQKSYDTGVPLRIKMGVDPTAPDVHFGHTVVMRKLRLRCFRSSVLLRRNRRFIFLDIHRTRTEADQRLRKARPVRTKLPRTGT